MADEGTGGDSQPVQETGRDFLQAVRGMRGYDRREAMRPGDYIEMPWKVFTNWHATQPDGKPEDRSGFPAEGVAKVSVVEIVKDTTGVVVEADGIRRKIDRSLFFNYGNVRDIENMSH